MSLLSLLVVFSRVRVVLREETRNKTRRFFDAELCVWTVFLRTPRERREKKGGRVEKDAKKSSFLNIFFSSSSSSSKKTNHFLLSLLFLNVTRNRYKFETTVSLHFTLSRGCFFTHQLLTALPFFENTKEKKKRKKLPSSLSDTRVHKERFAYQLLWNIRSAFFKHIGRKRRRFKFHGLFLHTTRT